MRKPLLLLLAVIAVFFAAPAALADHCVRCSFPPPSTTCVWGSVLGRTDCDDSSGICETFGDMCNHQTAALTLASEFEVASVERIDEAPAPDEALVAKLDAPAPPAESPR
ncbi:MAG TPA: hypothetical protein VF432_11285 [Thermoanaerobaculia bacterium]